MTLLFSTTTVCQVPACLPACLSTPSPPVLCDDKTAAGDQDSNFCLTRGPRLTDLDLFPPPPSVPASSCQFMGGKGAARRSSEDAAGYLHRSHPQDTTGR